LNVANASLGVMAVIMLLYARKQGRALDGVRVGMQTLRRTGVLLVLAFIIVGYVNVLGTEELIRRWIGPGAGWSGLVLAEVIGMLLPGGPYVVFPLIGALYQAGASIGAAVVLISSWALLALISVAFELPLLGWRFTLVRWGLGLPVPILAGAVSLALWGSR
jgi:uncharacterized protein